MESKLLKFVQKGNFDIARKSVFFATGFCVGAGVSYIRFNIVLSILFFCLAFILHIFNIKLKVEEKMFKWDSKRFLYLVGCLSIFFYLSFSIASFCEKYIEGGIGCIIIALIVFLIAKSCKKYISKVPIDEKK